MLIARLVLCVGFVLVSCEQPTSYAICNGNTVTEKEWIRDMYTRGNAVLLTADLDAKYTVEACTRFLVESKQYDIFWSSNDKAECEATLTGVSIATWFVWYVTAWMGYCNPLIGRDTNRCRSVLKTAKNIERGVNLQLSWPDNLDFVLQTRQATSGASVQVVNIQQGTGQSHQFTPLQGKRTHWAQVALQRPGSLDPIYQFPSISSTLYQAPLQFSSKGFLGYENDAAFTSTAKLSKNASDAWGVTTTGCNPPSFTFRTSFVSTSEVPDTVAEDTYGSMLSKFTGNPMIDQGISDTNSMHRRLLSYHDHVNATSGITQNRQLLSVKRACYRRVVEVIRASDQPDSGYTCRMDFSTLSLRESLYNPVTEAKATTQKTTPAALVKDALVREAHYAASTTDMGVFIAVSPSYVEQIVGCAMSEETPGHWSFNPDVNLPGSCVLCGASTKANARSVRCGLDAISDCCDECMEGYVSIGNRCVKKCKLRTQAYTIPDIASCQTCPVGKVQNVSSGLICAYCSDFPENGQNSVADPKTGACIQCGMLKSAHEHQTCMACDAYAWVPAGKTACERCPSGTVLRLGSGSGVYSCVSCQPGTYQDGNECLVCLPHTVASKNGTSACTPCLSAYQTVGSNRTACVPCPSLNASSLVEYASTAGLGCTRHCVQGAYAKTSGGAYITGGCVSCSTRTMAVGTYPDAKDCTIQHRCTNAPSAAGVIYTSAATSAGVCEWGCAAGYRLVGTTTCAQCTAADSSPAYDASIHVYVVGSNACVVACKPKTYSTGGTCLPCQDLYPTNTAAIAASRIFARVRWYNLTFRAPRWEVGRCGTNATVPSAAPIFLQKVARYAYYGGEASRCGDGLLQRGEECDDGNTYARDGCSPSCALYPYSGYDCDLLGESCRPNCGWTDADIQTLGWYILPNASSCVGISYYDYRHTEAAARLAWLRDNMLSCICTRNSHAQLPRQACTVANEGCRTCSSGQYHEDMGMSRCVECGSTCPAGYMRDPARRMCGPDVHTASLLELPSGDRYLRMGCIPCLLPNDTSVYAVSYISECRFSCKGVGAMSTVANALDFCSTAVSLKADNLCRGYYCTGSVSADDGACTGSCRACTCPDAGGKCAAENLPLGQYWATCSTGRGVVSAACDRSYLPANASFLKGAGYGMSKGCPWECNAGFVLDSYARCAKCLSLGSLQCASGQVPYACSSSSSLYYCLDCYANTQNQYVLRPFEVWATVQGRCVPTCAPGAWLQTAYSVEDRGTCVPCTTSTCGLGQYLSACNSTADAVCVDCPTALSATTEYVGVGICDRQCVSGYYRANALSSSTILCAACVKTCAVGQYQTPCDLPERRLQAPTCATCSALLNGTAYATATTTTPACATVCISGWRRDGSACVPCNASVCFPGTTSVCENEAQTCVPCPATGSLGRQLPVNEEYSVAGSCVTRCQAGTARASATARCSAEVGLPATEAVPSTPPPSSVVDYPVRALSHSNGSIFFDWLQP